MLVETRNQCAGSATHPGNNDVYSSDDSGKMTWLPFPKDVADPIGWAALPL